MQQITIVGNLGKDAVIRKNDLGEFLSFNVCVTETFKKDGGETREISTWYSCINKKTALAAYLKKGVKVLVQGELRAKATQGEKEPFLDLTVQVQRIQILLSKSKS